MADDTQIGDGVQGEAQELESVPVPIPDNLDLGLNTDPSVFAPVDTPAESIAEAEEMNARAGEHVPVYEPEPVSVVDPDARSIPISMRIVKLRTPTEGQPKTLSITLNAELCELVGLRAGDYVQVAAYGSGEIRVSKAGAGL